MSKYIIEIEDKPFVRLSALFGEEGLYRAKGFNSLVFDQFGLDKLTPLDKELEEAYQKGAHEGSLYVKERVDGAYQKGFEVGQHEATTEFKRFTRSVSFGLFMFCVGLIVTLVFLLIA